MPVEINNKRNACWKEMFPHKWQKWQHIKNVGKDLGKESSYIHYCCDQNFS